MDTSNIPHFSNIRVQGDRISSAANVSLLQAHDSSNRYFDRVYGHTWRFTPKERAAVYGKTENFPPSPVDHLASEFIRVPFRRVPVINVSSAIELETFARQIWSADSSLHLMWRGQTKMHMIS